MNLSPKKLSLLLIVNVLLLPFSTFSQAKKERTPYTVSIGTGILIYQSVYSLENSIGIESSVGHKLYGPAQWQAGIRLGITPVLPEVFGRVILVENVGIWNPAIGLELGLTSRAYFPEGSALLRETREAMLDNIGIVYFSIHAAPLSFQIQEKWELSALELDLGTHFKDFGRTLRAQLILLSVSRKF